MPNYRRARIEGAMYFFTVVTFDRRSILTSDLAIRCLKAAWSSVRKQLPFRTIAVCVLPDHLHAIWALPEGDGDFSGRWNMLKSLVSKRYLAGGGCQGHRGRSRHARGEAALWQRRFWEHWIRDEEDLRRHVDYIHFNPVKLGYVARPRDWRWSSFHRFVREGWYEADWGEVEPEGIKDLDTVGE